MHDGFNISFDDIHKIHSKCNTYQIMRYQIAINFHRVLNFENLLNSEQITILEQMVCVLMIYCGLNNNTFKLFLIEHTVNW